MKNVLGIICLLISSFAKAQKIDSIFIDLYTDSLKKGTYNYINIDGHLMNGRYLPLDTSQITLTASAGKFYGNSLWIDADLNEDKITIKAVLKSNPSQYREFDIYIKKKPDDEKLKTTEEILNEIKKKP